MTIFADAVPRTSDPLTITFPKPFAVPPVVLATSRTTRSEQGPVESIETVTRVTTTECQLSSANDDSVVNVLAIDPGSTQLGSLKATAGQKRKSHAKETIHLVDRLTSNDPVVLLAPRAPSQVNRLEYLYADAASEIVTYSENYGPEYSVQYLAMDRGIATLTSPIGGRNAIETGTYNKTGVTPASTYRVYFDTPFTTEPLVFLSSWWDDSPNGLDLVETVTEVTTEYFEAQSGNGARYYFVNWMAFGEVAGVSPG